MPSHIKVFDDVLDKDFCKKVIEQFKSDNNVADDPQPDYSRRRYLNLSEQRSWLSELSPLLEKSNVVAEQYFHRSEGLEETAVSDWLDDGFIMSCYSPGDDLALHADGQSCEYPYNGLRLATLVFFLCNCEGGELYFPMQGVTVTPRVGRAVMFPSGYTHPHGVKKVASERFIIQTWLTDPNLEVIQRGDNNYE